MIVSYDAEALILTLTQEAGRGRSITPEQVARQLAAPDWRGVLPQVRAAAVALAGEGRLVILRHGRPVDPQSFKGVYRLKAPDASG